MIGMMGKMGPMGQMECGPDMMKKGMQMKEKMMSGGFNPQEMCSQMTSAVTKAAEMTLLQKYGHSLRTGLEK